MTKPGFTLLELIVVLAIVGIMGALIVPNLAPRRPKKEREQFVAALNALTKFGWQRAVSEQDVVRIEFDFDAGHIKLLQATGKKDDKGEPAFAPPAKVYRSTVVKIPRAYEFKNFYVEAVDEMSKYSGGKYAQAVWFYISSNGIAQSVTINFFDTSDKVAGKPRAFGLVLNPFSAQFKVYSEFKTPQQ